MYSELGVRYEILKLNGAVVDSTKKYNKGRYYEEVWINVLLHVIVSILNSKVF